MLYPHYYTNTMSTFPTFFFFKKKNSSSLLALSFLTSPFFPFSLYLSLFWILAPLLEVKSKGYLYSPLLLKEIPYSLLFAVLSTTDLIANK
jgi:hypothetical protein